MLVAAHCVPGSGAHTRMPVAARSLLQHTQPLPVHARTWVAGASPWKVGTGAGAVSSIAP
jgi:hypothetical protein